MVKFIYPSFTKNNFSDVLHHCMITQKWVWFSAFFDVQKAPNTRNDPFTFLYFYYSLHGYSRVNFYRIFSMSQLWTVDRWRAPDHWSALMMSQRHGDRCRFNGIYYIYMHVSWALACITREWGTRARNIRLSAASVQILRAEHVIPVSNGSTAAGFHAPWMFPFIRVLHQGGMRLTVCALLFRVCRVGWSVNGARRSLHPSPLLALFRVSAVTVPRR